MTGRQGPNFAEQLAARLGPEFRVEKYACAGTSSVNWAPSPGNEPEWCGENHEWARRDLYRDYVAWNLPADIVVLMLGTNDAQLAPEDEDQKDVVMRYWFNMTRIVDRMLRDGAGHIFLMAPPRLDPNFGSRARLINQFRSRLQEIAGRRPRVTFGPDLFRTLKRADHFKRGPHPTLEGHTQIANSLYDSITSLAATETSPAPERPNQ